MTEDFGKAIYRALAMSVKVFMLQLAQQTAEQLTVEAR